MEGFGAVPLMLSGFSIRILERLHLGKSSRENKLQIPTHMGKGLCSRSSFRDLGRGCGRLGPAFNGSDMEPPRPHGSCAASTADFTLEL